MLLLVLLVVVVSSVQEKRISQIKCEEYRLNPSIFHRKTISCFGGPKLDVEDGEFPHQVLLGRGDYDETDFHCEGTLISERYVLTAAHCVTGKRPDIVRLGETDLWVQSGHERDVGIESIVRHRKYRYREPYHDIALIKLNETLTFSEFIRPACLWSLDTFNETALVVASGFGKYNYYHFHFTMSATLRKIQLGFANQSECEQQYLKYTNFQQGILGSQLCILNNNGVSLGDYGSPLHITTDPAGYTYQVIGISSEHSGIGLSPSIYTRVASYIDWIEKEVWGQ